MLYAEIKKPDFLVIETGLGGRFDATNSNYIKEKYPVITHIGADHREILGRNIYSILDEKLAIVKDNSPVFIGYGKRFISEAIRERFPNRELISPTPEYITEALNFAPPPFNLNLALAMRVSEHMCGGEIPFRRLPLPPCRRERFGRIVLEGAHNESGILALTKNFSKVGGVILSATKERDIKKFIYLLAKITDRIILTSIPDNPRSITADTVRGLNPPFIDNPAAALAKLESETEGDIIVTGSLYLCAFMRKVLAGRV
jgi:dihydrofolate synthase/folylpolyglutamate synthase